MEHCYLLHFSEKIGRAGHYLGTSKQLEKSLQLHKSGQSKARLIEAAIDQGITFQLVRVWEGGHETERRLKARKNAPTLCPVCNLDIKLDRKEKQRIKKYKGVFD